MSALKVTDSSDELYDHLNECAARAEKRQAIFAEIDKIPWTGAMPTSDEIVATVHAQRDERDAAILEACGFYDEI